MRLDQQFDQRGIRLAARGLAEDELRFPAAFAERQRTHVLQPVPARRTVGQAELLCEGSDGEARGQRRLADLDANVQRPQEVAQLGSG